MKKCVSCGSTFLGSIISQAWKIMRWHWKFLILPILILGIVGFVLKMFNGLLAEIFSVFAGIFVVVFIVLTTFAISQWRELVIEKLSNWAKEKTLWVILISVVQVACIGISFVFWLLIIPYYPVLALVGSGVLFLIWFYFVIRLFFVDYIYLIEDKTLNEAFVDGFSFSKKVGRWTILWKLLVFVAVFVVILIVGYLLVWLLDILIVSVLWWDAIRYFPLSLIVTAIGHSFLAIVFTIFYLSYKYRLDHNLKEKDNYGCFYYGCLVSSVLLVLLGVWLVILSRMWVKRAINNLAVDELLELPSIWNFTTEQQMQVEEKMDMFVNQLTMSWEKTFEFDTDELNLILKDWSDVDFSQYMHAYMWDDDLFHMMFSVPLDNLDWDMLKWKYVYGDIGFWATTTDGRKDSIFVTVLTGQVNWETPPSEFWEWFSSQNLLEKVYQRSYLDEYKRINHIKFVELTPKWLKIITK